MSRKCSFDEGAGFKNDCECLCENTYQAEFEVEGIVYACRDCNHLHNGFVPYTEFMTPELRAIYNKERE